MESMTAPANEDGLILRASNNYREEAKTAKRDRMEMNKRNFDVYHLKQDYAHKMAGQSREFLGKQSLAVEQISSFFQQGLVDIEEWFSAEKEIGTKDAFLTESEVKILLGRQLDAADFFTVIHDAVKLGLIGSLMIIKVHGEYVSKPTFQVEKKLKGFKFTDVLKKRDKKIWKLKFSVIRQEDYFCDPSESDLFEFQDSYIDLADLWDLSEPGQPYKRSVVELVSAYGEKTENDKMKKARETGQTTVPQDLRRKVKLTEYWGSIIDPNTGKYLYRDVTWTVANDQHIISDPKPFPFWHGKSPFVVCPLVRVPGSKWHKAAMDAPTRHNVALNELYNLIVDAGMMATHGIKQIRTDVLEDQTQVSNGISAGTTLSVTASLPYGAKVLERVDTSALGPESLQVFNLMNSEFQQSAMTNDLRMGVLPSRQVKATEVVEASQTITSLFTGMSKQVEDKGIKKVLEMAWLNVLQHMDDMDADDIKAQLGEKRTMELASLSNEARFAKIANGHKFRVFGISRTLDKVKDFRKLTGMLQTVFGNPMLTEEFVKEYAPAKLLAEILRALDIDTERLKMDEDEQAIQLALQQGQAGGQGAPVQSPNMQSQTPQASTGTIATTPESLIPHPHYPASPVSNLGKG